MNNPVSTYRIQFHKDFRFEDFEKIIPYLHRLGIKTVYASPVFEAAPGSQHGYDGVNPNAINPEIGTEDKLRSIHGKLHELGMSWLQDIVPNHMAFHSNNEWFMDVLEKGRQSEYASFFDVIWTGRLHHGRIMVPFLGSPLDEVIGKNELSVVWHEGRFALKYYESYYPLRPSSYTRVLKDDGDSELQERLEKIEDEIDFAEKWEKLREEIASLMNDPQKKGTLEKALSAINSDRGMLRQLTDEQYYKLCHWQETDRQINFRRFFTVNSLICLNIHRPEVFRQYHELVKKLVEEGIFQGLRIDHIDGLYDPADYLEQLRELVGEEIYIIVEKILEPKEELPERWPVQGNTGYDFLSMVNNLLTDKGSEKAFSDFYRELSGDTKSIHQHLHDKKSHILYHHMGGELENLYQLFMRSSLITEKDYAQMRTEDIRTAIAEFLIQCPVYRYYGDRFPLDETEARNIGDILARIRESRSDLSPAVNLLEEVLLRRTQEGNEVYNTQVLRFYQRCMQFTGPLMAKGVEDTLMYSYNRFIGHNEVGDSPEAFGYSPQEFHAMMQYRQKKWPLSLNATSTHDTKRGEDVRARLNVLSGMPEEWFAGVREWREMNAGLKRNGMPDANDEYFIYQTLAGAWPMPGMEDEFGVRLGQYLEKALREGKIRSDWTNPDTEYEEAAKSFARRLLDPSGPFLRSFAEFHRFVADAGIINSLVQLVLRFSCPGVPDTYQGTELWDLSLVDPDNRRPVDYSRRQAMLAEPDSKGFSGDLWEDRYSGKIKLRLLQQLLKERSSQSELFTKGEYIPLAVEGEYSSHVIAFARRHEELWLIVVLPLNSGALCRKQGREVPDADWGDTRIILPEGAARRWRNILNGEEAGSGGSIAVGEIFAHLPFALCRPA